MYVGNIKKFNDQLQLQIININRYLYKKDITYLLTLIVIFIMDSSMYNKVEHPCIFLDDKIDVSSS